MERQIDTELKNWIHSQERKVLLVRGARQVGKTYAIRQLGKHFDHFLEVNFEEDPRIHAFFEGPLDPAGINEKLSAYFGIPIIPGKTLLFFDEIQACLNAVRALRFYQEKLPALHTIAAGSLLEFALSEISSFGVGRISYLFMYPLTFREFLWATGNQTLEQMISKTTPQHPIDEAVHLKLMDKFRIYQVLGGMPAVIAAYVLKKDLLLCQKILDELIVSIQDDFSKYKKRSPVVKLQEVFHSVAYQAGKKFKYSIVSGEGTVQGYKEALELLVQAAIAHKVYHTSARGIPLGAQVNPKKFKVILFDLGVHQRLLGLSLADQMTDPAKELIHKGALAEVFIGLELLAHHDPATRPQLYYWHREERASNAEVDYVVQKGQEIIPIEVKAGTKGQMQSLFLFLSERNLPYGIRMSHENFTRYEKIMGLPVYALRNVLLKE